MLDWGDLPSGTKAQVYLPEVDAAEVIRGCIRAGSTHIPVKIDANTVELPASAGISYLPVAESDDKNFTGLITVDLPLGIRKGQRFNVVARQVTPASAEVIPPILLERTATPTRVTRARTRLRTGKTDGMYFWRRVSGSFEIRIPVRTREVLLFREERLYSILKWIRETVPTKSRWWKVFDRYVSQIGGRVAGFGGNPGQIPATPDGAFQKPHPKPEPQEGERHLRYVGKIVGVAYDQFGDFEGFALKVEDDVYHFKATEHAMERIVVRAWRHRVTVKVVVEAEDREAPTSLIYLRSTPPGPEFE
jgi:hypothetical protein